mgnify:CR=1 FL=1
MKDKLNKIGLFTLGLGVVLVPTYIDLNVVDKTVKNASKANMVKNILTIGGIIGGIIVGSKQVKKYELKQQTKTTNK